MKRKIRKYRFLQSYSFIALLGFLFLASTVGSIYIFSKTTNEGQASVENAITQSTNYTYNALVKKSNLYPDGGTVSPGDVIFESITTEIPVQIEVLFTAQEPVQFIGSYQPVLTIVADNLWRKEIELDEKKSFDLEGTTLQLFDQETYVIKVQEVQDLISSIEQETSVMADNYTVTLHPNVQGTIFYNGVEKEMTTSQNVLQFTYTYNKYERSSEMEYFADLGFQGVAGSNQTSLGIFGFPLPMNIVKVLLVTVSICLIIWIIFINKKIRQQHNGLLTEAEVINKKYSNRMITVANKIDLANKSYLSLQTFEALMQFSEERELPIFHYVDRNREKSVYFIMDGNYLYSYEASNVMENETSTIERDVSYG